MPCLRTMYPSDSASYDHSVKRSELSRIFLITILMILTLQWFSPLHLSAEEPSEEEDVTSSFRVKIRRLQQGIVNQENQIAETEIKERNILEEMEALDNKLVKHQDKLRDLGTKMKNQQSQIERAEMALTKTRDEKANVEKHLKKRVAAYYTMGNIGLLNVTFSTKTLPELLTFHDAFDTLIKYDQDVIKVYLKTIKEIEQTKSTLDLEKAILEEFIRQNMEESEILEQTKDEKRLLLTHIRTQTKLHQQAIDEMQQATEGLSRSIQSLKSKNQISEDGFLANKGSLPPPVDGVIITLFNQEKVNKLGISRKCPGIELKAPDGTTIVAVAEGEVIFSGYLRGYGNTVIIHHGLQYHTVTARIEKLLVNKGQKVKADDPIGIMGDTAILFDEGISFEIRHGHQSMDPLIWLNPNRLSTLNEQSTEQSGTESSVQ